jgi:hypothetical protein
MKNSILNNNKLLRSKSGLSFFMLLAMASIVLFTMYIIAVSTPHDSSIYDSEFKTTKAVDTLSSVGLYNNYYVDFLIENSLEDFKTSFFTDLELEDKLNSLKNDETEFIGCSFQKDLILYNEAYLAFQNLAKEHDSNKNLTLYSCFPEFSGDFSGMFEEYVDKELNEKFNIFFRSGDSKLLGVYVNSSNSNILVDVKYKTSESVGSGSVYLSDKISTSYSLNNFDVLIDTLGNVLPKMSKDVKSSIISCKKSVDVSVLDVDLFCIKKVFDNLIKNENLVIFEKFNFDFTRIDNEKVLDFYGIKVDVVDVESKKNVFDFSFILENNLPIGQVDYKLDVYPKLDNVIELDIVKPNLKNSSLNGFVVLYSYEEFLQSGSYSKYSELIKLLEDSKIPKGFKNLGISNSVGEFRGSDKGSGLDLSLFFVKNLIFDENSVMNLKIHQIWNEDTEAFDLLDNREVYFAVFAVDSKFNYFTDEGLLKEVFSGIMPERKLGPKPIAKEQVKLNGAISGFDNSIELDILNYGGVDDSANSVEVDLGTEFEVYVIKGNLYTFDGVCLNNISSDCKKSSFTYLKNGNNKLLVSSNSAGLDTSKYGLVINTEFVLGDGSDVRIYLVPVNSKGVGFYETVQLEYSLNKVQNFYELSNTPVRLSVFEFSTKITDKRAPALSDIKDLSLNYNANVLHFVWKKTNLNSDVEKVLIAYTHSGGNVVSDGTKFELVDESGVMSITDFKNVEIIRAVPVDKIGLSEFQSGNIMDAPAKSGITYSK